MRKTWMFVAVFIVLGLLLAPGCNDTGDEEGGISISSLYVEATVGKGFPGDVITVTVRANSSTGEIITDATVTVNSVNIPYDSGDGKYISLSPTINVGDNVNLEVIKGSFTVSATITMPEEPVILSPTAGGPYDPALALTVEWQSFSTQPDDVLIGVDEIYTTFSDWYEVYVGTGSTTHNIPGGTFQSGLSSANVCVGTENRIGSLGADAAPSSIFKVFHGASSENFATL